MSEANTNFRQQRQKKIQCLLQRYPPNVLTVKQRHMRKARIFQKNFHTLLVIIMNEKFFEKLVLSLLACGVCVFVGLQSWSDTSKGFVFWSLLPFIGGRALGASGIVTQKGRGLSLCFLGNLLP